MAFVPSGVVLDMANRKNLHPPRKSVGTKSAFSPRPSPAGVASTRAEHLLRLDLLKAEHDQRLQYAKAEHGKSAEYARVEHERRMQVIEAEAALVEERRQRLADEASSAHDPSAVMPATSPGPASLETIREALTYHLGSPVAADAWLNSPETGYPTTAMDAIREGKADLVSADLEQQWGPSPAYA